MRVTQIRVGRTYNMGRYTSCRFDLEADIDEDEPLEMTIYTLATDLHQMACAVMHRQGFRYIFEEAGTVSLAREVGDSEEDDDAIPY